MDEIKTCEDLRRQTIATKKKISDGMMGPKNSQWVDGHHPDHYRRVAGAKKGELVHHKDGNRSHNTKSNLKVIPKSKRGKHDKLHFRQNNFKR